MFGMFYVVPRILYLNFASLAFPDYQSSKEILIQTNLKIAEPGKYDIYGINKLPEVKST